MRLSALVSICITALIGFEVCGQEPGRSPLTSQLRSLLSAVEVLEVTRRVDPELPAFPLIIRVHEKALVDQAGDKVDTTRPVSCVVLGTPASGTSRTIGAVGVDTSASEQTADFLVTFRGQSFSRTVGVNGPARIYSHSLTNFVVTRHVTLSPMHGFQSPRTSISSQTSLTLDDVRSTKPGLRGRLVRRIGWRRAQESNRAAEQIVAQRVRGEVLAAFDQQLDQRVAELNRQWQTARYVKALFGDSDKLSIRVSSEDNCVQIAVGQADSKEKLPVLPVATESSPVEVWMNERAAEEQAMRLAGPIALLATGAKTLPAVQTVTMAVWNSKTPAGIGVRSLGGWTVLSFDSQATRPEPHEISLARRSSN